MSFPRYPTYKDSDTDWLGEVPEHWSVNRFKVSVNSCTNGVWGEEAKNDENDVICIRVADFDRHRLEARDPDEPTIRNVSDRDIEQRSLRSGDLLIEKSGGGEKQPVGAVVLYKGTSPAVCSNFVARMRLKQIMSPSFWRYAHHAAYSLRINTKSIKQTSGIQNLDQQQYFDEKAAYPPFEEQQWIASFLDRETAKIDALIAEQQRLIELLQEKRQAVISHAVTKGLNPNAPMKDSGVEWLGEVPEHWEVGPVKRFFTSMNYKRIPLSSEERSTRQGEYPYYGASGVIDSIDEYLFDEPLVLVSEDGANLLMRSTPIAFVARGKYWVNNHAHILKPKDGMPVFWSERIESLQIAPFVTGSAQPKLTAEALMNLIVAAPPEEAEKEAIDRRIQEAKEDFSPLLNTSRDAIALLQERRSALISAAVTGQIDVRGLATEEEA